MNIYKLFLLAIMTFAYSSFANEADARKEFTRKIELKASTGQFLIKGSIVDENNIPLDDVFVSIDKCINLGLLGTKSKHEKKKVNSQFSFNIKGCNNLYLLFSKKGYYSKEIGYVYNFTDKILIKKNQKIVLQKIGEISKYKSKTFVLRRKDDGSCDVLTFPDLKIARYKNPENIHDKLPNNSFYLVKGKSKEGKVILDKFPSGITFPKYIKIIYKVAADSLDGMIVVNGANQIRELREAPPKGYDTKFIERLSRHSTSQTFIYFKHGQKYAKARIINVGSTRSGGLCAMLQVIINMEEKPKNKRKLNTHNH